MGPKLAQQTPARLISCVWVPWCVCLCAHIALSLYHTFEVILVDGFCDVALPHFEIKDSSKICRFFLFLMCCLYGVYVWYVCTEVLYPKCCRFCFVLFFVWFSSCVFGISFNKGEDEKTLLQSLQFLWGLTPKKAATMLQFTKGSKLFTDYSPRFWLFSKDPSTVYVH